MSDSGACPCVNLECMNHGDCEKCVGHHVHLGNLNYCSFYTILPALEQAIITDPESPAAVTLRQMLDGRLQVYDERMRKHGLSEDRQAELRRLRAEHTDS